MKGGTKIRFGKEAKVIRKWPIQLAFDLEQWAFVPFYCKIPHAKQTQNNLRPKNN